MAFRIPDIQRSIKEHAWRRAKVTVTEPRRAILEWNTLDTQDIIDVINHKYYLARTHRRELPLISLGSCVEIRALSQAPVFRKYHFTERADGRCP